MAVTSPVGLKKLQTEFGADVLNDGKLTGYIRGVNIASHEPNSAITTSGVGTKLSEFLNTSRNCIPTYGDNSGFWNGGSSSVWNSGLPRYIAAQGYMTYSAGNAIIGGGDFGDLHAGMSASPNSIDVVGKSISNTNQATIVGIFEYVDSSVENDPLDKFALVFSGNHTGTWWYSISAGGFSDIRGNADVGNGVYDSGENVTYWTWSNTGGGLSGGFSWEFALNP